MILDDCLLFVWVPVSDTVTTFALRDQEKFDHSAADYLPNYLTNDYFQSSD